MPEPICPAPMTKIFIPTHFAPSAPSNTSTSFHAHAGARASPGVSKTGNRGCLAHAHRDRVALRRAGADRRDADAAAARAQLVHERRHDARAGGADRVTERHSAALHVHLLFIDTE